MAATQHLLHARAMSGSPDGWLYGKSEQLRRHPHSSTRSRLWLAGVGVPAVAATLLVLLLAYRVAGPCSCSGSLRRLSRQHSTPPAAGLGPTTDAPMMVLPPYAPTCKVKKLGRDTGKFGCPIMSCRMDANCTLHDPSCCAYLHYEMLTFFHRFLASKCLQHEYVLAHGTALGAVRDHTIIPHTQDLDVAVTPLLLQFLELNSTREELWRHGYAVFMGDDVFWKFHPHIHHPKPEFRAAFRAMGEHYGTWQDRTNGTAAVYMVSWQKRDFAGRQKALPVIKAGLLFWGAVGVRSRIFVAARSRVAEWLEQDACCLSTPVSADETQQLRKGTA